MSLKSFLSSGITSTKGYVYLKNGEWVRISREEVLD